MQAPPILEKMKKQCNLHIYNKGLSKKLHISPREVGFVPQLTEVASRPLNSSNLIVKGLTA